MNILDDISSTFWSEWFWLPPNVTWKDIEPGNSGINHADYRHLLWPIPISFCIILIRSIFERCCFRPIGKYLGVKSTRGNPPPPNKVLEAAYEKKSKLDHATSLKLSKQCDMSAREIERWWRKRKSQDKPTTLVKFCENCWRGLFYFFNFSFGLAVLWDKPCLWNLLECVYNYPHHEVTNLVWWYYMISMAFYWSLTFSQFTDNKRKDFWQTFVHHILTLLLFSISWVCNYHQVGSLIILIHDCADIFLETAKTLKYAKLTKAYDIVVGLFTITWIITRLIMFPRLIYTYIFRTHQPVYPVFFLFNSLFIGLLILHCIWTVMLFRIIKTSLESGKVEGDVRSSSSEDDLSEDDWRKNS